MSFRNNMNDKNWMSQPDFEVNIHDLHACKVGSEHKNLLLLDNMYAAKG